MKRFALISGVVAATAAASIGTLAPAATAGVHTQGNIHASVALEQRISDRVDKVNDALTRIENRGLRTLDTQTRAEVRANIDADQAALVELQADADTAATVGELREILAQVQEYRAAVYVEVVTVLDATERLEARVEAHADDILSQLVDLISNQIDVTVEGALTLDATSDNGEVREVRSEYDAAVRAFAKAQR